jgi:hypothetical protein
LITALDEIRAEKRDIVKKYTEINYLTKAKSASYDYDNQIAIFEGKLRIVNDKIDKFDDIGENKAVSIVKTYRSVANDLGTLFGLTKKNIDITVILLMFFFVCAIAATVDGGAALMMYFSAGEWSNDKEIQQNSLNNAKEKPLILDGEKVDPEAIRLELPNQPIITDTLAQNDFRRRYLFYGTSGGGKTVGVIEFLNKMAQRIVGSKTHVYVIDPKRKQIGKWPGFVKEIIGTGENHKEIKGFLIWLRDEISRARSGMSDAEIKKQPTILLIIDEIYQLTLDFKRIYKENFADYWSYILTYTRENGIYFIGMTQSATAKSLGFEGQYDVTRSFTAIIEFVYDELVKPSLRYVVVRRAGKKTLLFRPPNISFARRAIRLNPTALLSNIKGVGHQFSKLLPGVGNQARTGVLSGVHSDTSSDTSENRFSGIRHHQNSTNIIIDTEYGPSFKDSGEPESQWSRGDVKNRGINGGNSSYDPGVDTKDTSQFNPENSKKTTPENTREGTGVLADDTSKDTTNGTSEDEDEAKKLTEIYQDIDGETEDGIIRLYKSKGSINKVCQAKWGKKTKARGKKIKAVLWANKLVDINAIPIDGNNVRK